MSDTRASRIQQMFSRIARRYDLMNRLMTFGREQAWRSAAARELHLPPNALCLDLATGTGDLALAVCAAYPTARVIGMDFSLGMLHVGERKLRARREARVEFAAGDALHLPFADEQFDGVVNGFLLRNVVDLPRALAEMRRVTKRGGRVVSLEITHPPLPIFREFFRLYFYRVVPLIGGAVAGDLQAYSYLPNSLTAFPAAEPLRQMMLQAGYREVRYRRLSLGAMALHVAEV
ncbi:MAG: bifunctional demethylmenaquinone methyltransferase/2-methoxy-6-polyprenyl-1,4-benzoquinol methylase UbiE [Chloroflexi bacterium]|nr:bifunctional demethylmenaquinone methyltransferase/2-methoxy-6-polyprenyl-1,4-benzoquinol methylase UbiE [Chloroflexota bacterium]